MYLWWAILLVVFFAAAPFGVRQVKRSIREQALRAQYKKHGSEATKALDDHLRGEW